MNTAKRREIFLRLQAANPHPTTELEYSTPLELLVAVMLSAQATDVSVNAATRHLFPNYTHCKWRAHDTANFLYDCMQESRGLNNETFRIARFAPQRNLPHG